MIAIFALVLFFLALFAGLGLPLARALRQPLPETLFAAFFLGWGLALTALQLWNLLLPVNLAALIVALAASLAGWGWAGRPVIGWLRARPLSQLLVLGSLSLVLVYLLVNQSLFSPSSYDHGLYHLPVVRWLQTYRIVPGLGNLHHRLAFNNSSFLVVAMMDSGPQQGLIYYTATTMLFAALVLRCLLGAYRTAQGAIDARNSLYALMLPVMLWYAARPESEYAGYATDTVVLVFQGVLAAELLRAFDQAADGSTLAERRSQILLLLFGAAVGLTVKISFAVFGLGIALAALWLWFRGSKPAVPEARSALGQVAGIFALVVLPWLARGALFSGYLLYPSTLLPMPFRWTIPIDMAAPVADVIRIWARTGGSFPPDAPYAVWFDWWFDNQAFEFKETWLYTALLLWLVILLRIFLPAARSRSGDRGLWALLAITLAGLGFWFASAPAARFAGILPWLLPLIPALLLIRQARCLRWLRSPNVPLAAGMLLLMLWLQPAFTNNVSRATLLLPPREHELAADFLTHDPNRTQVTNSGLAVYLAAYRGQELCFDQPLPCTRANDFDPRLSLLVPGDLASGFWVDLGDP